MCNPVDILFSGDSALITVSLRITVFFFSNLCFTDVEWCFSAGDFLGSLLLGKTQRAVANLSNSPIYHVISGVYSLGGSGVKNSGLGGVRGGHGEGLSVDLEEVLANRKQVLHQHCLSCGWRAVDFEVMK